jgi:hypothetical protein
MLPHTLEQQVKEVTILDKVKELGLGQSINASLTNRIYF